MLKDLLELLQPWAAWITALATSIMATLMFLQHRAWTRPIVEVDGDATPGPEGFVFYATVRNTQPARLSLESMRVLSPPGFRILAGGTTHGPNTDLPRPRNYTHRFERWTLAPAGTPRGPVGFGDSAVFRVALDPPPRWSGDSATVELVTRSHAINARRIRSMFRVNIQTAQSSSSDQAMKMNE